MLQVPPLQSAVGCIRDLAGGVVQHKAMFQAGISFGLQLNAPGRLVHLALKHLSAWSASGNTHVGRCSLQLSWPLDSCHICRTWPI